MSDLFFKQAGLSFLLVMLMTSVAVQAQDVKQTTPEDIETKAKSERIESSSDLREAVNENLESIQKDAKKVDELKKTQQEQQSPPDGQQTDDAGAQTKAMPDNSAKTQAEQQVTDQAPEKSKILGFFKSIPGYLQSVPDRVPFIRNWDLIFFGRTEIDGAYYSSGVLKSDSGLRLRSFRLGLARAFKHDMSMKAEIDLTDGDTSFADLYVRYRNTRWGLFTIGNQKVAQTLVNQTSRLSRTFMEEPLPAEAFGLGRRLALGWDLHKKKGGLHMTVFGPDLNGSIGDSGYASRIYFNPARSRLNLFHVGASFVSENMSRKTRFFSHPESRVTSQRLVDTGIYDDIQRQAISALELAGARGSFMFRSEYFRATWDRNGYKDPVFQGIYAQASWVLTGEPFKYTQGKFLRIRPQNPRGAWETAVRISWVDLSDRDVRGGEERNLTAALNWYAPGNQLRVMSNLIFVKTDEFAGNEDTIIFQMRAQFHW
jgi:phosphate-selective porin OprO/OprP